MQFDFEKNKEKRPCILNIEGQYLGALATTIPVILNGQCSGT